MNSNSMPVSWFDVVVLVLMLIGFLRGRVNGGSAELWSLLKWLAVIVLGNLYYKPLGNWFAAHANVTHNYANVFIYIFIINAVWLTFAIFKKIAGEKVINKDRFGRIGTPVGMVLGAVRYLCYVFIGIALLNTPIYHPHEIARPLANLQEEVIYNSATGVFVRQHLAMTLLQPVPETPAEAASLAQRREQEMEEIDNPAGRPARK